MPNAELQATIDRLRQEATRLAGELPDLTQRAAVYYHLYQHSGGNHAFPLIAAHGALWARGYFNRCLWLARGLAWQYLWQPELRRQKLAELDQLANQFRDINRRVCIDTYVNYHFTALYGQHPDAEQFVPIKVLEALNRLHASRAVGREMSSAEKRSVFEAHFLHEQENVVGPVIRTAVDQFAWPLVKFLALKPVIHFAFFPGWRYLWFTDFSQREQRVANGMTAFDTADRMGWKHVEATLRNYRLMPPSFFSNPAEFFTRLREATI